MKKKKQQTKNLIILAVVTVGIVLGLWAMKSNFSLNSKAAEKCKGGGYFLGNLNTCYQENAKTCSNGYKCCAKKVEYSKCKNKPYYNYLKKQKKSVNDCKGNGYSPASWGGCYLIGGKVCGTDSERCCNKRVDTKFCNK